MVRGKNKGEYGKWHFFPVERGMFLCVFCFVGQGKNSNFCFIFYMPYCFG